MPPARTNITDVPTIATLEILRLVEHVERGNGRVTCPRCNAEKPNHAADCELGALLDDDQHARFMDATTGATVLEVLEVRARERAKAEAN